MKRIKVTSKYQEALYDFMRTVERQKSKQALLSGTEEGVVYSQDGRKYDKIMMRYPRRTEVLFFVERTTGKIFGKKNPVQPNLFWWFNNIRTAHLWNWAGEFPEPVNDESVVVSWTYGDSIKHYRLKTEAEMMLDNVSTPLPMTEEDNVQDHTDATVLDEVVV
jgi:hypothetical protein